MGVIVGALAAGAAPRVPSAAATTDAVRERNLCFTVHNPGDPTDWTVRGTLFHTSALTEESTAVLLLHGGVAERTSWDGGRPSVHGSPSIARRLAAAGYGVFAIDRLGYAASPYQGTGWSLTAASYIEMTHEIVTQIRGGTFGCPGDDDPTYAPARVVLSGFSSGGALTMGYALAHHDIAGIIPMGWSTHPEPSAAASNLLTNVFVPQWLHGNDYIEFFADGADGYSESCEQFLFHVPGSSRSALRQWCGSEYYAETRWPTPSGEATVFAMNTLIRAGIGAVGPTPVLLVFGDRDAVFPGPHRLAGDPDTVTSEHDLWRDGCNCDVSLYLQPDAGHANFAHRSVRQLVHHIVGWLHDHDL